jgi:hypothetical protein
MYVSLNRRRTLRDMGRVGEPECSISLAGMHLCSLYFAL